jgi:hypothetical protein
MALIDQAVVLGYVNAGAVAVNTTDKGRALEDLICYVFQLVPGIHLTLRNQMNVFLTEEVDVAFFNNGAMDGFIGLPDVILIEAKNWSARLGSEEVAWFDYKVASRGMPFGIIVTTLGITGDQLQLTRAHKIVSDALQKGRRLIVITVTELQALADTDQLVRLIKQKILELVVKAGLV